MDMALDFKSKGTSGELLKSTGSSRRSSTQGQGRDALLADLYTELIKADKRIAAAEEASQAKIELIEKLAMERALALETKMDKKGQDLDADISSLNDKVDEVRVKNVEVLAVFVGLFTFVSVDFQILRKIPDWNAAVGLIWISVGMLLGFILLTDFILTGAYRNITSLKRMGWQLLLQTIKLAAIIFIAYYCLNKGASLFSRHEGSASSPEAREQAEQTVTQQPSPSQTNHVEIDVHLPGIGQSTSTR